MVVTGVGGVWGVGPMKTHSPLFHSGRAFCGVGGRFWVFFCFVGGVPVLVGSSPPSPAPRSPPTPSLPRSQCTIFCVVILLLEEPHDPVLDSHGVRACSSPNSGTKTRTATPSKGQDPDRPPTRTRTATRSVPPVDVDGDGVINGVDLCPGSAGKVSSKEISRLGCGRLQVSLGR